MASGTVRIFGVRPAVGEPLAPSQSRRASGAKTAGARASARARVSRPRESTEHK